MASDNQVQLLAFSYGLATKPGETVTTNRSRGKGRSLAPQNQLLWADGASQPWSVAHLGAGKL